MRLTDVHEEESIKELVVGTFQEPVGGRMCRELCITQIVAARPMPLTRRQLNGVAVWVSRRSIQAEPPRCRTGLEMMSGEGRRRGTSCPSTSTSSTDGVL